MSAAISIAIVLIVAGLTAKTAAIADEIPLIDAHSQLPSPETAAGVIGLMDKAGIAKIILSFRGKGKASHVIGLWKKHPDRIVPSIKTKGRHYQQGSKKFYSSLAKNLDNPAFGAMAEMILWHAQKGDKAPQQIVAIDSPQVQAALNGALDKNWPFILHIEFAAARKAGDDKRFMKELEALLMAYPNHPFPMIHMAQLQPDEVRNLILKHPNIYFITSHSNPHTVISSQQPWTNMFVGDLLSPEWKTLMSAHPDRFIFAIDNVWPEHWSEKYVRQVATWRNALMQLPHKAAHMIGHENAERLWRFGSIR
ncbi:MAG: hypothetical protein ACTSV1_06370 [Alphaproteobacteria bacterium]